LLPKPDVAIYSRGLWGLLNESRARQIMPSLFDWVSGKSTGRCFFRSSTANYRSLHPNHDYFRYEFQHVRPHVFLAGCSYIDYAYLTETFAGLSWGEQAKSKRATERKSIFVDTVRTIRIAGGVLLRHTFQVHLLMSLIHTSRSFQVHFMPWVYEELNQVLLNVLCNAKPLS
jgi:hypothetical protein